MNAPLSTLTPELEKSFSDLRQAARSLRQLKSNDKNALLNAVAERFHTERARLLKANAEDLAKLKADATPAFRDRLTLNDERINAIIASLKQVAELPDPVGEIIEGRTLPNGLKLKRVRAPLGVILMIFESRPNVISEAFSLALKSGNAIALRGGSESSLSANLIYDLIEEALKAQSLNPRFFLGIRDYDRAIVGHLLTRTDLIDIVVPRGGDGLIRFVTENSRVPVIKNDRGLCHAYVDDEVDLNMAVKVVKNAKISRPGVCNSLETVLVHEAVAKDFIEKLYDETGEVDLEWRCDEGSLKILGLRARVRAAAPNDWNTEYLDQILNCKIVENLQQALDHIDRYGSRHSETILTRNESKARRFQNEVDAAVAYWNASTRFTDGFEFGLGGELGISTQKLHVRGPVGLKELTSARWLVDGEGQVR